MVQISKNVTINNCDSGTVMKTARWQGKRKSKEGCNPHSRNVLQRESGPPLIKIQN